MARIELASGHTALIDEADVDRCFGIGWVLKPAGNGSRCRLYVQGRVDGVRRMSLHRFLLQPPDDVDIDHINGDGLDNRRSNLRLCTTSENAHNRHAPPRSMSGFLGVHPDRNRTTGVRMWRAMMRYQGHRLSLGIYETPEDAARARDYAAGRLMGQFAVFNLPNDRLERPPLSVWKALRRFAA